MCVPNEECVLFLTIEGPSCVIMFPDSDDAVQPDRSVAREH